ncbi:MAG: hypothetical protein M3209_12565 [Acidobacteriota bacterium]|nr:hypothetical protein [Acidobacteriota bacterium]
MFLNFNCRFSSVLALVLFISSANVAFAQTTAFTYQGKLNANNLPANASYDFEFRLFDAATGGTVLGTQQRSGVQVSGGFFTVVLDFGANAFSGANQFLEIAVKTAGSAGSYQQLLPRQSITSIPQAIRSLSAANADAATTANNSLQLGGVAANQYVQTTDARLSDARNPLLGSPNYIQSRTTQQPSSNFNISGTGMADIFDAAISYNLRGDRVLSVNGTDNVFVGISAGSSNTTGYDNSFFGESAGEDNTTGYYNSFFGSYSGSSNTTGDSNSFFGGNAGANNTTGSSNSFFGRSAGSNNTGGFSNSFFGKSAGLLNTTGGYNSFFGLNAGYSNTTGYDNSFFGYTAGSDNTTGRDNSFFGKEAGTSNTTGIQNSFFGRQAGFRNVTGGNNVFVGYRAGYNSTAGTDNVFVGSAAGYDNTTGSNNTIIGDNADVNTGNLTFATAIGAGALVSTSNTIVLGRDTGFDKVRIYGLGAAGATPLCRNASNEISTCSSSLTESASNSNLLETVKTQDAKILVQQKQIEKLETVIEGLRAIVCSQNPQTQICKEQQK